MAGALFGLWGKRWIESEIPDHIRGYLVNYGRVDLDSITLAFTLGIALLCGLVFGLAPACEHSRRNLNRTLKEASGQASDSKRSSRLRRMFVAAEIALAVVVLIATTLLVKSFVISVRSSPGYNPANVMVAQLALPKTKYTQDSRLREFSEEALARIRALPQVVSVGAVSAWRKTPCAFHDRVRRLFFGDADRPGQGPPVQYLRRRRRLPGGDRQ
jgi:putative ABC transport system permease protein